MPVKIMHNTVVIILTDFRLNSQSASQILLCADKKKQLWNLEQAISKTLLDLATTACVYYHGLIRLQKINKIPLKTFHLVQSGTTTSCRIRQNLAGSSDYRLCLPLRPHKAVRRGLHHSLAHATSLNSH